MLKSGWIKSSLYFSTEFFPIQVLFCPWQWATLYWLQMSMSVLRIQTVLISTDPKLHQVVLHVFLHFDSFVKHWIQSGWKFQLKIPYRNLARLLVSWNPYETILSQKIQTISRMLYFDYRILSKGKPSSIPARELSPQDIEISTYFDIISTGLIWRLMWLLRLNGIINHTSRWYSDYRTSIIYSLVFVIVDLKNID